MSKGIVETFENWLDSKLKNIHTCLPGRIDVYYGHAQRKAKVKILLKLRTSDGSQLSIPSIDNVPVIFPGSDDFSLLYPLKSGDGCLILFSEEGIGNFLKSKVEVAADNLARFQLTDAICIPGLWSFPSVPKSTQQALIEIESKDHIKVQTLSGALVDMDGENININNGTEGVARNGDSVSVTAGIGAIVVDPITHANTAPITITGTITDGSSKVKAG